MSFTVEISASLQSVNLSRTFFHALCQQNRFQREISRNYSSSASDYKYITTPIFYVNDGKVMFKFIFLEIIILIILKLTILFNSKFENIYFKIMLMSYYSNCIINYHYKLYYYKIICSSSHWAFIFSGSGGYVCKI